MIMRFDITEHGAEARHKAIRTAYVDRLRSLPVYVNHHEAFLNDISYVNLCTSVLKSHVAHT